MRSLSFTLDMTLALAACIFVVSSCILGYRVYLSSNTDGFVPLDVEAASNNQTVESHGPYYDFQRLNGVNLTHRSNHSRQYYYIDLGCFDARDIDFFIHFHRYEIKQHGELSVIGFEPDPINYAACKAGQQRHPSIKQSAYQKAAWTENGQVRYATENGQKSKIDSNSALFVQSADFSRWVLANVHADDFVYVKFTIEGAEVPVLEKMVTDGSLRLVDYLEIEWHDGMSRDLEPRRVALECMFDNFGMDYLYMINPVDVRHAYNTKSSFSSVPKDRGWYVLRRSSLCSLPFRSLRLGN